MRVNMTVQPLLNTPLRKALLYVTRRDPLAEFRQEQRIFFRAKQPAQVKPVLNPGDGIAANGQAALFAALAHHPHFAGVQVEVF